MPSARVRRLLAIAVLVALPRSARAQTPAGNEAAATELFDKGMELLLAGSYADACPKLAASQRLDPQVGTLLYLAVCHEKAGQLATAFAKYREAEELAQRRNDERQAAARQHAQELVGRLPRIALVARPGSDAGLSITIDGAVVDRAVWSAGVVVDPGEHTVAAVAPQKKAWSRTVRVEPDTIGTVTVRVPALEDTPPSPASQQPGHGMSGQRVLALVVGGVGVVGVGVGAVLGLVARSRWEDAKASCPGNVCKTQADLDQGSSAGSLATGATIGFVAGGVCLGGAAVLWLTSPSPPSASPAQSSRAAWWKVAPSISPGGAALVARGAF